MEQFGKFFGLAIVFSMMQYSTGVPTELTLRKRSGTVAFRDCGSTYDLYFMTISSCSQKTPPCKIPIGKYISIKAEFLTEGTSLTTLHHEAYWVIKNVETRVTVLPEKCSNPAMCPYRTSDGIGFFVNIFVNDTLPTLGGELYWRIYNNFGQQILCYSVPIELMYREDW